MRFLQICFNFTAFKLSFQPHCGSGVYSACDRNEYGTCFGSKARQTCKSDNLTAISEPSV
jgi:hypothetical protein